MAQGVPKMLALALLLLAALVAEAAPPGLTQPPKHVRCMNNEYKECNNLVHVCPKFCPDSCTVDCRSCKPICAADSIPPTPSPFFPPPTLSPPPPPTPSPPPPQTPSPPPPPTPSPPPPPTPSPPPPPTPSPPPPPTPSPPPPPTPSPPPPPTPSPPPPPTPSPPPPSPTPSPPPPPPTSSGKKVRCRNQSYTKCYGQDHVCPANCANTCEVDCVTCKPVCKCDYPGAVCQDPRFIGGDGITFYFHGKKDADFTLVTDPNLHINAHFIGKRSPRMTRDFTWVQSLGILYGPHRLFVGARKTVTWDDSVDRLSLVYDNQPIFLHETEGATWRSGELTITRIAGDTNSVAVEVEGKFKITTKVVPITRKDSDVHSYGITSDDCFAHLDIGFRFYSLTSDVEGVLGKTYREDYVSKVKVGATMPVVGGEREYQTSGLFATDCKASRFGASEDQSQGEQIESFMNCGSGMNGAGVVCKR